MYSANGRVKKEQASNTNKKQKLVCKNCDYVFENVSKEFGEKLICPKCGVEYTYTFD